MQHPDEGMIHAWLDGALSADEAARLEAHVKDCAECAAAVAEARGFIAGSSRILTALDNAPRGVIPVARPRRRFDATMVRIAASVLVVAAGTLVVVENQRGEKRPEASVGDSTSAMTAGGSISTARAPAESPRAPAAGSENSTPEPDAALRSQKRIADNVVAGPVSERAAAPERRTGEIGTRRDFARPGVAGGTGAAQNQAGGVAGVAEKTSPTSTTVPAPAPPVPAVARSTGVVALDRAVALEPLKVIDTTRRIGTSVTVYEVAGDTVTLTESQRSELSSIVVTGVAKAAAQGAIDVRVPKQAAAPTAPSRPDSIAVRAAPPSAAAIPPPSQGRSLREAVEAIHTISWSDPATGNTLTLSGKMSEARLQEIRLRIERERMAAAKTRR